MPTINFSKINKHDFVLLTGQLETLKLKKNGSSLGRRYVTKKLNGKTYEGSLTSLTQALVKYKGTFTSGQKELAAKKIKTLDKKTEKLFPKGLLTKILRFFRRLFGTHLSAEKRNALLDSIWIQTPPVFKSFEPVPELHLPKPNPPAPQKPKPNLPQPNSPLASYEATYLKKYTEIKGKLDRLKAQWNALKVEVEQSQIPAKSVLIKMVDTQYELSSESLDTCAALTDTIFSECKSMGMPCDAQTAQNIDQGLKRESGFVEKFETLLNDAISKLEDSKKNQVEMQTIKDQALDLMQEWILAFIGRLDEPAIKAELEKGKALQAEIEAMNNLAKIEVARKKKQELDELFENTKNTFLNNG